MPQQLLIFTLHARHIPFTSSAISQVLQKALEWLAEQPEDASELAALLSEAVPKLGFHTQKSRLPGISRAATSKQSLELLHADMSLLQRLKAARPMLVGTPLPKQAILHLWALLQQQQLKEKGSFSGLCTLAAQRLHVRVKPTNTRLCACEVFVGVNRVLTI